MKYKTSLAVFLVLALLSQSGVALAVPPHARHKKVVHAKKRAAQPARQPAYGPMPCSTVAINAKEDREIIILKLTQRIDCLENKVNYLSEQVSLQSSGTVKPFVESPKEYVIRYPREAENP